MRARDAGVRSRAGSGLVTCGRCAGENSDQLSAPSLAGMLAMVRQSFGRIAAVEPGRRERREIGQLLHHLFLHHVEVYRLPKALHLLKGER